MKNGGWQKSFTVRTGYKAVPDISKALYKKGRRVLKKDVIEIKDPTITEVAVKLEPGHLKLYKKLVK
jgi:hypothetical protein